MRKDLKIVMDITTEIDKQTPAARARTAAIYDSIRRIIQKNPVPGALAIALLGATLAAIENGADLPS